MPTYQYRCTECDEALEMVQKFADDPLTICPSCQGRLRKVFSPVGVVFKGSGFYKTDSRSTAKRSETPAKTAAADGASAGKSDGASSDSPKADAAKTESTSDGSKTDAAKSNSNGSGSSDGSTKSAPTPKESVHKVA